MVDIYLVRHGQAASTWGEDPDPGLSPLGRQQAQQVRDELEPCADLDLVRSPLLRAQQTVQPLAATLRKSVITDEVFREIPSPVGIGDRQAWLSGFMKQQWSEQSPEILEWREAAWNRLFEFERHTAIFSHFMIINAICSKLTGSGETVCCLPDNGAIVRLSLESDTLKLVDIGRQMPTTVN